MSYFGLTIVFWILFVTSVSCTDQEKEQKETYHIEWKKSSLVCIADEGAYPRLHRLQDSSLLAVFENRKGDVVIKRSIDEGLSWGDPHIAYELLVYSDEKSGNSTQVNIANPEIVQLDNGDLLLACNLRPQKEGSFPFSIALKRSTDNGNTWSEAQILYKAASYFKDGCWEPSFLVLPDGTIHLYFANESPYRNSDEQEISMLSSADNGITWSREAETVSFREGFRDGMPVAVHNEEHIFISIEDNVSGQFKPYIISKPINTGTSISVSGSSLHRRSALKKQLPDTVYAGAPYLIRTHKGLYLLSYQTTENRTSVWEHSVMEVVVSEQPYDFINPSRPFDVPFSKGAKWNSLSDLGNNTIAAVSSTSFDSDQVGIWMIKGEIQKR